VAGSVAFSGISVVEFNNDKALQSSLQQGLAAAAGSDTTENDVVLVGARDTAGPGGRRSLLSELVVDYYITFPTEASAGAASTNIALIDNLPSVVAHAKANGYSDVQVAVLEALVIEVGATPTPTVTPTATPTVAPTTKPTETPTKAPTTTPPTAGT
jgi:hypothetical protein